MTTDPFHDVAHSVLDLIGHTPLVNLSRLRKAANGDTGAQVLAKMENANPGGSVKDRIARRMIEAAEQDGALRPGTPVVEFTSGNTGIGLAMTCGVKGYRFIAVMSEGNSVERRQILAALGAEVELVPQAGGPRPGNVTGEDLKLVEQRAGQLAAELGAFRPDQFLNRQNPLAHEETTGVEIWEQTGGRVTAWVAAVGTGGTFVGVARALKKRSSKVRTIAVEPAATRPLAGMPCAGGRHRLQGTGYGEVPPQWDAEVCDELLAVSDLEAMETARLLAAREGILVGFSSGANVAAALRVARSLGPEEVVVTVCCDTGLRYLSGDLFPEPGTPAGP